MSPVTGSSVTPRCVREDVPPEKTRESGDDDGRQLLMTGQRRLLHTINYKGVVNLFVHRYCRSMNRCPHLST